MRESRAANSHADKRTRSAPAGFFFFFHPPQLKAGFGDRGLDHAAVEIVGRRRLGPDDADRVPGPELLRQLAAALIVREGLQALTGVRFENEDAHGWISGCELGSEFAPARGGP